MHGAAIPVLRTVISPVRIYGVDALCRQGEDVLDVAVAKLRIGFEHQRHAARNDRGSEGGALRDLEIIAESRHIWVFAQAARRASSRIGRASVRERVEQNGSIWGVPSQLIKQRT